MPREKPSIPSIKICLSHAFQNDLVLREIVSGVEEESVPYEIVYTDEDDGVQLSYWGAEESPLDVGIGLDSRGGVAVHYKKLPPARPLFEANYTRDFHRVRSMGANAARLVKRTPFIIC